MMKPDGLTDAHLTFLDELRASGAINMFGATPYLASAFGLDAPTARAYLSYWMRTFGGRQDRER